MAKTRIRKTLTHAGRPLSPQAAPYANLGISGVTRYGAISRVYEEFLRELQGPTGMKLYREAIDNCPIIGAILFACQFLARAVTFRVDPARIGDIDRVRAEAVAHRLHVALFDDLEATWPDQLSEILTMLPYGWALHEVTYKKCLGPEPPREIDAATGRPKDLRSDLLPPDLSSARGPLGQGAPAAAFTPSKYADGFIGWKSLGLRAQETLFMWEWDEASRATVMQQMAPPDYRVRRIPLQKALLFRTQVLKQNPEGRSIIRNAMPSYLLRKNLQQIEAIGIERDLAGYPVFTTADPDPTKGLLPPDLWNAHDPEMVALLASVKQMAISVRRDEQEGMVLPWWLKFSLVSAGGSRAFDTNGIISRYDKNIAISVLADFVMLGHEAVGSKALASTKSALFTTALSAFLDNICAVFTRFAFPQILALNGIPLAYCPTLAHGDTENVPIEALGEFIAKLSSAGMPLFPNGELETALLEAAKLPAPSPEGDLVEDPRASASQDAAASQPATPPRPRPMSPPDRAGAQRALPFGGQ